MNISHKLQTQTVGTFALVAVRVLLGVYLPDLPPPGSPVGSLQGCDSSYRGTMWCGGRSLEPWVLRTLSATIQFGTSTTSSSGGSDCFFHFLKLIDPNLGPKRYVGLFLSCDGNVQVIEVLCYRAVDVEPPVTDEVLLVEEGAVGTEEGVLYAATAPVVGTDVKGLALSTGVGIVATVTAGPALALEVSFGDFVKDGIVLARDTGDRR